MQRCTRDLWLLIRNLPPSFISCEEKLPSYLLQRPDIFHKPLHHLRHIQHIHRVREACRLQGVRAHLVGHGDGIRCVDGPLQTRSGTCQSRSFRGLRANSRFRSDGSADQDEGVQASGDAVGVVAFRIVTLSPPSRGVAVSRGLLLLNASLYRQGGVAQLQAVLTRGDACKGSGPPAVGHTQTDVQEPWSCAATVSVAATDLNSPRLLTTFSSGQKEALSSSTTISTLSDVLPRSVDTTHSHSPLASTWTLNRMSSLGGARGQSLQLLEYCAAGLKRSLGGFQVQLPGDECAVVQHAALQLDTHVGVWGHRPTVMAPVYVRDLVHQGGGAVKGQAVASEDHLALGRQQGQSVQLQVAV